MRLLPTAALLAGLFISGVLGEGPPTSNSEVSTPKRDLVHARDFRVLYPRTSETDTSGEKDDDWDRKKNAAIKHAINAYKLANVRAAVIIFMSERKADGLRELLKKDMKSLFNYKGTRDGFEEMLGEVYCRKKCEEEKAPEEGSS